MVAPDAVGPGAGAIGGGTIVLLSVHAKLPYGLMLGVAGDADALGAWEPELAYRLTWTEGHIWTGRVELPPGTAEVNYKLVTMHKKGFDEWEDAPDRALHLADAPPVVTLSGVYGGELKTNASFEGGGSAAAAAAAAAPGAVRMPPPPPPPPIPGGASFHPGGTGTGTGALPDAQPVIAPDFGAASARPGPPPPPTPPPPTPEFSGTAESELESAAESALSAAAEEDDPYAAFEARVSATFAKLRSAAERTRGEYRGFESPEARGSGSPPPNPSAFDGRDARDGGGAAAPAAFGDGAASPYGYVSTYGAGSEGGEGGGAGRGWAEPATSTSAAAAADADAGGDADGPLAAAGPVPGCAAARVRRRRIGREELRRASPRRGGGRSGREGR